MVSEQSPAGGQLTAEERAVLKECEKESFYTRALPLSCGAIVGVQYLVRTGKLARHPTLGALPKSIIAGGLAYMFGKLSYMPECRNKILEKIPDSNLATAIKRGQAPTLPDMSNRQDFSNKPPASDSGDDRSTGLAYPADPRFGELNDSQRPSLDNEVKPPESPEQRKSMTYDDLRQKNRNEYNKGLSQPSSPSQPGTPSYKDSPYMPQKTWPDKTSPQEPPSTDPSMQTPPKRKRTNMWGDVIED